MRPWSGFVGRNVTVGGRMREYLTEKEVDPRASRRPGRTQEAHNRADGNVRARHFSIHGHVAGLQDTRHLASFTNVNPGQIVGPTLWQADIELNRTVIAWPLHSRRPILNVFAVTPFPIRP